MQVVDATRGQLDFERRAGKMWHSPRAGRGTHVDEAYDAVQPQQLDELCQRPGRVTDRQDDYYRRCDGSTSGTRTLFVYVCPLYWNVPENMYTGS